MKKIKLPHIRDAIAASEQMLEHGISVMPILPGEKIPVPSLEPDPATGKPTWIIIRDPDDAEIQLRNVQRRFGNPNVAALMGRSRGSPILSVDLDGPSGLELAPPSPQRITPAVITER